ncbi:unnamed protein product [Microthlaspi erraticum]|uniref:Transposase MuDR plant domain-containing protein n=1 Tax=Microthlaspi erraticum TaxID=1685480 RepID=A0A6D2KG51_9BRAS|nr:unnamed protein product [Microthlaspi erraticum]
MQEDTDSDIEDSSNEIIAFRVGQAFSSKDSFRKAIDKYAVDMTRNIRYKRSETTKVGAVCAEKGCPWNIYASINSSSKDMVVRTFVGKHTCSWNGKVQLLTSRKICDKFIDEFRRNPGLKAGEIRDRLRTNDRLLVSKDKCRETRRICTKMIADEYEEQFTRMYDYVGALKESNPGSTVILGTKAKVFDKFYSCFAAMKEGWKNGCRRILHLDGTFMKGKIKGEVLTAVGRDANDKMFPVAWAIVSVENKPNWEWFMTLLQEDLDLGSGNGLTLVSDQQKGLIAARDSVLPHCEHRMCARHIWANLYKKFGDETGLLHIAFWKMAKAYNMRVFEQRVEDFKLLNHEAYERLMRWSACHWSRAFFTGFAKCDAVENNMSESFNNVIDDGRFKPLVGLLEDIRIHVMTSNEGKIRMIEEHEGETCSNCLKKGHTKRTCSNEKAIVPPKKPRGRPSKNQPSEEPLVETTPTLQSQPTPTFHNQPTPAFHSQPNVPIESHGVFHSPLTGDDYICVGRSVRDMSTNIVLSSSLFREHERNKLNIKRRKT